MTATLYKQVGSDPFVAVLVAIIVLMVGLAISRRVAQIEGDQRFVKLLMLSLVLHILCAPAQIWVVDHIYHGVADYTAYVNRGASLSSNLRSGNFSFANTNIPGWTGDNVIYIISGIVETIVGPDKLAEFIFFSGVAFVGEVAFLRAFSTTFPEVNPRRYALLLFFLPSILFWTADASKETIMIVTLGVASYGAARILMRQRGGYRFLLPGLFFGVFLRPDEVVLLLVGFAAAMMFRVRDTQQRMKNLRRVLTVVFVLGALAGAQYLNSHVFHETGSISSVLQQVGKNNSVTSEGSSVVLGYSANPLYFPKDVYTVVFDPLPFTAHGKSELLAGLENLVIVVIILSSLRQLKCLIRACRLRPYVLLCTIYSLLFMYAFAALGNLGLIYRERTLLLPFMLVVLSIPVSKKDSESQFPWERKMSSSQLGS